VVEPDPTHPFAASARSAASIRQQFSTPLNIALSTFGIEFLRTFHHAVADVGLVESTYLYLASAAGEAILRQNVAVQRGPLCRGAPVTRTQHHLKGLPCCNSTPRRWRPDSIVWR
jgi:glycine/D-amino acid oxidase-like deaminating enzyme